MSNEESKLDEKVDEVTAAKALAVNVAVIEVIEAHRDEVLSRAVALLKAKGIDIPVSELTV